MNSAEISGCGIRRICKKERRNECEWWSEGLMESSKLEKITFYYI